MHLVRAQKFQNFKQPPFLAHKCTIPGYPLPPPSYVNVYHVYITTSFYVLNRCSIDDKLQPVKGKRLTCIGSNGTLHQETRFQNVKSCKDRLTRPFLSRPLPSGIEMSEQPVLVYTLCANTDRIESFSMNTTTTTSTKFDRVREWHEIDDGYVLLLLSQQCFRAKMT